MTALVGLRGRRGTAPEIVRSVVIALDDSTRLPAFFARPGAEQFVVQPAVDARRGEGADEFAVNAYRQQFGTDPGTTEMAIAASHYRVLRAFAEEDGAPTDVLAVAEDDALLSSDYERITARIVRAGLVRGVVVLAHPRSDAGTSHVSGYSEYTVQLSLGARVVGRTGPHAYRVGHYVGVLWGTGLYLVSRDGARQHVGAVHRHGGIPWLADDWGYIGRLADLDVRFLRPNLAGWIGDSTFREQPPVVDRFQARSATDYLRRTVAVRTRVQNLGNSTAAGLRDLADVLQHRRDR